MKGLRKLVLIMIAALASINIGYSAFALSGEWGSIADMSGNGDANCDSKVDGADLDLVKDHIMGISTLSTSGRKRADSDKNGVIDIRDYNILYDRIFG